MTNNPKMVSAGYSGTPLIKKLGIKPHMKLWAINPPDNYLALLSSDLSNQYIGSGDIPDLIHLFAKDLFVFESEMETVLHQCRKNTTLIIWVSWYKKNSGIKTDLSENSIRDFALCHKLVDIKVCAVSDKWSGLKLVVPLSLR